MNLTLRLDVLSSMVDQGRVTAQLPEYIIDLDPQQDPVATQARADAREAQIEALIEEGLVAWKVATPKPGLAKTLYTQEARNPATGRLIGAYLWLTPLAVMAHGPAMHARYRKALDERNTQRGWAPEEALALEDFETKLLRDCVPAAPAFQSQVPADILARMKPAPKLKATAGVVQTDGYVPVLGPRNTSVLLDQRWEPNTLLAKLDQWRVGASTRLSGGRWQQGSAAGGGGDIERIVIREEGVFGLQWLQNKGFAPRIDWLVYALTNCDKANRVPVLEAIVALGVDPTATLSDGSGDTLWHVAGGGNFEMETVAWLKAKGVDWSRANASGEVPLRRLLSRINYQMGVADFYELPVEGMGGGSMGSVAQMLGMLMGRAQAQAQQNEHDEARQHCAFLSDLAIEMVASGVDPFQKARDGSYPWQAIMPEQMRAQQYLVSQGSVDTSGPAPARALGALLFGVDRDALRRTREAYGTAQLAFIERMERASGVSLLDGAPAIEDAIKPKAHDR